MSSSIPAALLTALTQKEVKPYYAVEFLFDDTPIDPDDGLRWDEVGYLGNRALRLWNGYGDKTINGDTYVGSGNLLGINGLEQTADLSAVGATVTLSGIPDGVMSLVLTEPYQGRPVSIYLGERSVSDVVCVFAGSLDTLPVSHSSDSIRIQGSVESKLITLQKPNIRRHTTESHKNTLPSGVTTDSFFDWVPSLQDKEILWGRTVN